MSQIVYEGPLAKAVGKLSAYRDGFQAILVLRQAIKLGVFDCLAEPLPKGITVFDLGEKLLLKEDKLERFLNALVALDVLSKEKDNDVDHYKITPTGQLLTKNGGFQEFTENIEEDIANFDSLADDLRLEKKHDPCLHSGNHHHHDTTQSSGDQLDHHPNKKHRHNSQSHDHNNGSDQKHDCPHGKQEMTGCQPKDQGDYLCGGDSDWSYDMYKLFHTWGKAYSEQIVRAINFKGAKHVVDLGGGSGVFSLQICRTYPDVCVSLMDVPGTIDVVKKHFLPKEHDYNLNLIGGDFLKTDIPEADLYLLSMVVHDWKESVIEDLLKILNGKLEKGGRVVFLEKCLNEDRCGPICASLWDLFIMPTCKGRLRTGSEYVTMFNKFNFDVNIIKSSEESIYDIIIATKM